MTTTIDEICSLKKGEYNFNHHSGVKTVELDDEGNVSLILKVEDYMRNPMGTCHGGVLFTLCDAAAATYLKIHDRRSVTLNASSNFYRPALVGDTLTAKVTEKKPGKTVSVIVTEVYDQNGKLIADSTLTMYRAQSN